MIKHFVLLDACVASAYYAPKSTQSKNLKDRSKKLLDGKSNDFDVRFLIPNFCIGEVFAVFEKYRWGRTWNKQVKKSSVLAQAEFQSAREDFGKAIHNGRKISQVDLNRYHILCIDLISPVNNAYKIQRDRKIKKGVVPASTYDMLIASMGIWLKKQFGEDYFTIVTGDDRLFRVVERAKSSNLGRPIRKHMKQVAGNLDLIYGPNLYPHVINFTQSGIKTLRDRFSSWEPSW